MDLLVCLVNVWPLLLIYIYRQSPCVGSIVWWNMRAPIKNTPCEARGKPRIKKHGLFSVLIPMLFYSVQKGPFLSFM